MFTTVLPRAYFSHCFGSGAVRYCKCGILIDAVPVFSSLFLGDIIIRFQPLSLLLFFTQFLMNINIIMKDPLIRTFWFVQANISTALEWACRSVALFTLIFV